MPFCHEPMITCPDGAEALFIPAADRGYCMLAEAPAIYRPRHPERTGFYQLFETHFESYVRAYEERFEARSGPLRPVKVMFFAAPMSRIHQHRAARKSARMCRRKRTHAAFLFAWRITITVRSAGASRWRRRGSRPSSIT
jgi:hypothetical protein